MKPAILAIFFGVLLAAAPISAAAQEPAAAPPAETAPAAAPMDEDDRLPFMQNRPAAAVPEPSSGGLFFKTLGAMLLVVGLIFAGAWGARKLGFGQRGANADAPAVALAVLDSVALGSGRTLSTVRFGERVLLVGSTPQSVALLAEEATPTAAARALAAPPATRSVAELLSAESAAFELALTRAETRLDQDADGGRPA